MNIDNIKIYPFEAVVAEVENGQLFCYARFC